MLTRKINFKWSVVLAGFLLVVGISTAQADQVALSYIDANSDAQTIILDCNTSTADLALAASLVGEDGVSIVYDPNTGCGTLAEIAAAMAAAAPVYAPDIAKAFAAMSPGDTADIVAAINAVPGVNTTAVLAAVHFGYESSTGFDLIQTQTEHFDLIQAEQVPSEN